MIQIDEAKKQINFHKDYELGQEALKTVTCDLLSAYICPTCKEVLLAYFKSDELIPVWKYDNKANGDYDSESDRRHYRYKVFYAGCGIMGIELKDHNDNRDACSAKIQQCYDIRQSVNTLFKEVEEKPNSKSEDETIRVLPLPKSLDRGKLINNLEKTKGVSLIHDVCGAMDPLIQRKLGDIEYEELDIFEHKYGSPERKETEKKNSENMKKAFKEFTKNIRTNRG